jgi:hypothetical protein
MSELCNHKWVEVKHEDFTHVCENCKQLKKESKVIINKIAKLKELEKALKAQLSQIQGEIKKEQASCSHENAKRTRERDMDERHYTHVVCYDCEKVWYE